jgi:hypothetical protein
VIVSSAEPVHNTQQRRIFYCGRHPFLQKSPSSTAATAAAETATAPTAAVQRPYLIVQLFVDLRFLQRNL